MGDKPTPKAFFPIFNMTKNLHIEHPEDSILTGNLSVLDAFLLPLLLSLKIDGAPAIVWGRNPANGKQFVGTKSVFNKKLIKICHSTEDIDKFYTGSLRHILYHCLSYLPITNNIYQGDFIGFGGAKNYRPNTITYSFPEQIDAKLVIAPHTQYYAEKDLRDAISYPLVNKLDSNDFVHYVQPDAYIRAGYGANYGETFDAFYDTKGWIDWAKRVSQTVQFVDDNKAKKLKINLNHLIRTESDIEPELFEGLCDTKLIEFWLIVRDIKRMALDECRHKGNFKSYINYNVEVIGEGFVMNTRYGSYKLVRRNLFSYANFNNDKFNNTTNNKEREIAYAA